MATAIRPRYSEEEYLSFERGSDRKHEYLDGEIFAMVGATEPHVLIVTNTSRELSNQLRGKSCRVYTSDMRVKVSPTGLYTYPDVAVVCGHPEFADGRRDTLLNPKLLVEVLSRSTEAYDRTTKFEHYKRIDSFAEYLLIAQDTCRAELYIRQPDGQWRCSIFRQPEDVVPLASIGCELTLSDVYERVEFGGEEANES